MGRSSVDSAVLRPPVPPQVLAGGSVWADTHISQVPGAPVPYSPTSPSRPF